MMGFKDLWFNQHIRESHFQEVIDNLLNLTYFIFVGAIIPWSDYGTVPELAVWRLVLLAIWVLVLRRAPIVMGLYPWIPALKNPKEAFFAGWFGPIGAGAVFYARFATVVVNYTNTPIFPIVMFIVLSSVFVHGASIAFFNLSLQRTSTYQTWAAGELIRSATLSDRITSFFSGFYTPADRPSPFDNGARPEISIIKLPDVKMPEPPSPTTTDGNDSNAGTNTDSMATAGGENGGSPKTGPNSRSGLNDMAAGGNAWDGKAITFVESSRETLLQESSGFLTSQDSNINDTYNQQQQQQGGPTFPGIRVPDISRNSVYGSAVGGDDYIEVMPESILVGSVTNAARLQQQQEQGQQDEQDKNSASTPIKQD
jgi:NhaP-type Na+/H+ or K+/H+ antiporter